MTNAAKKGEPLVCKYISSYIVKVSPLDDIAKYQNKHKKINPTVSNMKIGIKIKLIGFCPKNLPA